MGEMVSFPSNGDCCEGYLARPANGSGPGVIVVQEWWGLVDHVRDVADRFAAEGFVTLAPDFFHGASMAGGDVEVYDYPGSSHAFVNDQRPEVHDKQHSDEAWRRTIDLLKSRL